MHKFNHILILERTIGEGFKYVYLNNKCNKVQIQNPMTSSSAVQFACYKSIPIVSILQLYNTTDVYKYIIIYKLLIQFNSVTKALIRFYYTSCGRHV